MLLNLFVIRFIGLHKFVMMLNRARVFIEFELSYLHFNSVPRGRHKEDRGRQ